VNQGSLFLNIAFVLGCVMAFAGFLSILVYFFAPGKQDGFGWFFAEGLTTLILGGIVLANQLVTDYMVPVFFGMWILFCGVMRIVASLHLILAKNNTWIFTLALGFISASFGVYTFFNQAMMGIPLILLIGIVFLIQGVNVLVYGIFIPGKKRVREYDRIEQL
jgi:uncharacterized membrane protein HdeD (DUF308 family)